ncbi:unnamed protein product [Lampetra fluviatilis]
MAQMCGVAFHDELSCEPVEEACEAAQANSHSEDRAARDLPCAEIVVLGFAESGRPPLPSRGWNTRSSPTGAVILLNGIPHRNANMRPLLF